MAQPSIGAMPAWAPPRRRRLYLMRHGSVDYFLPDGSPVHPHTVALNEAGLAQAAAAGRLFRQAGVRFDRVVASGLARTVETAECVLRAAGLAGLEIGRDPRLEEIRPGRLAGLPEEHLQAAFLDAFDSTVGGEQLRFLGGETVGALLDRCLPAFEALLDEPGWRCALLVLHGGVNRALLGRMLCGGRHFLGRLEQSPGCINVIDCALAGSAVPFVVRALDLAPTQLLHDREQSTTMEQLLAQYLVARAVPR